MKFLSTNTLAHYNAAPQVHQHDLSELPTAVFSASTLEYRKACGQTSPNDDAVSFYTLNHCASIVRKAFTENEPLPEWAQKIMASYTDVAMAQGERMLHYILSITTREMRHLKSTGTATVWSYLTSHHGQKATEYLKNICSHGSETVAVDKYMKNPPDLSIGHYTKALAYAFHHGQWSGGYGGHPWGHVTDAAVAMLTGVTSMEMLVDTGYTLAHNGGPIFNKGMMYHMYDGHFMTILDVQRAGQLLDLMMETQTLGIKKTPEAVEAAELIKAHYPVDAQGKPTIKGFVDWKLVDELRPDKDKNAHPNKYQKLTTAQKQPKTKPASQAKVKATVPTMTTLLGKKVKITGEWLVYPNETVKVVERVD